MYSRDKNEEENSIALHINAFLIRVSVLLVIYACPVLYQYFLPVEEVFSVFLILCAEKYQS